MVAAASFLVHTTPFILDIYLTCVISKLSLESSAKMWWSQISPTSQTALHLPWPHLALLTTLCKTEDLTFCLSTDFCMSSAQSVM